MTAYFDAGEKTKPEGLQAAEKDVCSHISVL